MDFIRHYLLALQFFTRIPVSGRLAAWVGYSPAMLRASAAHFPGVGWLVGAVAGAGVIRAMALLMQGVACIERAELWPQQAPEWGQWLQLEA